MEGQWCGDGDGHVWLFPNRGSRTSTLRVSMVGYETVDVLYNGESFLEVPLEPGVLLESVCLRNAPKACRCSTP